MKKLDMSINAVARKSRKINQGTMGTNIIKINSIRSLRTIMKKIISTRIKSGK